MKWETELALAKHAAQRAGDLLKKAFTQPKTVLSEIGKDIKLQADQDAEAIIIEILSQSKYPLLAEESGTHGDHTSSDPIWVIDPLDGTMNFHRSIPLCCVSIGLMQGTTPLLGVIYDFNHDTWYTGIVGEGAWLNDAPMHVSTITQIDKAILATGFPAQGDYSAEALNQRIVQFQDFKKVRCLGSAAMSLALVSDGTIEAYSENAIMLWDIAAGVALVKAAGGHVDFTPHPTIPWSYCVNAVSSPALWETTS